MVANEENKFLYSKLESFNALNGKTTELIVYLKSDKLKIHSLVSDSGKQSNSHKNVASTSKNSPTPQRKAQASKKQRNSIAVASPGNKKNFSTFKKRWIYRILNIYDVLCLDNILPYFKCGSEDSPYF